MFFVLFFFLLLLVSSKIFPDKNIFTKFVTYGAISKIFSSEKLASYFPRVYVCYRTIIINQYFTNESI